MEFDIYISNEYSVEEALSELNSSYQNLCTIYSDIEMIFNSVKDSWNTSDIGGDAESYKSELSKNISLMKDSVLPTFKQFNQTITNLMTQYRLQQK